MTSENLGFGHANNCAAITCDAPYVLFLNPDTEILEGTFGDLVGAMERKPDVGLTGVIQQTADGATIPTIRYFPSLTRSLCEAFGSEQWPVRPHWARGRELDMTRYAFELDCDWTSGSFMLARREALLAAGLLDERFFMYSEEPDLCLRMKRAGWRVRHLPDDDHPSPRQGRGPSENGRAGRLHQAPVRPEALQQAIRLGIHGRGRRRICPAGGVTARRGRRQARGLPPGAAHARRHNTTSVWRSSANSAAQADSGNESTGVRLIKNTALRDDAIHVRLLGHGVRRPTAADA